MFNCIQLLIVLPSAQKQTGRERPAAWRSVVNSLNVTPGTAAAMKKF
jgi:hypothetical protein